MSKALLRMMSYSLQLAFGAKSRREQNHLMEGDRIDGEVCDGEGAIRGEKRDSRDLSSVELAKASVLPIEGFCSIVWISSVWPTASAKRLNRSCMLMLVMPYRKVL